MPHHSPAASGAADPPPVPAPIPGSTSTNGSITSPAMPSTGGNLIDLDSPAPNHIQGLMPDLTLIINIQCTCTSVTVIMMNYNYLLGYALSASECLVQHIAILKAQLHGSNIGAKSFEKCQRISIL